MRGYVGRTYDAFVEYPWGILILGRDAIPAFIALLLIRRWWS